MVATFTESGLSFNYPDAWQLEHEENEDGWTASLISPGGTVFFVLSLRDDLPGTQELADTALETLAEEYPDVEPDPAESIVAGRPAVGYDARFFYVDLTNSAFIRAFACPAGTALVLWQANDLELEEAAPALAAMIASLKFDAE